MLLLTNMQYRCYNVQVSIHIQSIPKNPRTPETQIYSMKTQFVLLIGATFALLLSSCTVYVDDNNRPIGIGQQPVHAGMFGPGYPYQPIGGTIIASGGMVGGLCSPRGPFVQGGFQTRPLSNRWGQVNPYGRYPQNNCGQPPPMFGYPPPQNFNRAGPGQANRCPPNYGPQPACFDPFTGRWR